MTSNELIKKGSNFLKKNKIKSHIIDTELIIISNVSGNHEKIFIKLKFRNESNSNKIF